jgi:transposase
MRSQYEMFDALRSQRVAAHRQVRLMARKIPAVRLLREIPGVGLLVGATIAAWAMDPRRFSSRSAISAYGGLGLGQGITNWQPISPTRASPRGNRHLKRVLFLAARAASRGNNALADRYWARIDLGWEDDAATRDVARKILLIACAMIRTTRHYDETLIQKPTTPRQPPRRRKPRTRKGS